MFHQVSRCRHEIPRLGRGDSSAWISLAVTALQGSSNLSGPDSHTAARAAPHIPHAAPSFPPVDPLFEMREGVLADTGADRPRSIRIASTPCPAFRCEAHPSGFHCELRGHIGAAPFHADKAQHGRAVHDPPGPLRPHDGDHAACKVMVAEQVHLKDFAQGAARQVFERGRGRRRRRC